MQLNLKSLMFIPRKQWLYQEMTEKLLMTLNFKTNEQTNKQSLLARPLNFESRQQICEYLQKLSSLEHFPICSII